MKKNKISTKETILYILKTALILYIGVVVVSYIIIQEHNRNVENKSIAKCINMYGEDNIIIEYEDTLFKHKWNCTPKYSINNVFVNVTGVII